METFQSHKVLICCIIKFDDWMSEGHSCSDVNDAEMDT